MAYTSSNITVDEAGNYTCVAYTSGPIRSEDQASATIDVSGIKQNLLTSVFGLKKLNLDFSSNKNATLILSCSQQM